MLHGYNNNQQYDWDLLQPLRDRLSGFRPGGQPSRQQPVGAAGLAGRNPNAQGLPIQSVNDRARQELYGEYAFLPETLRDQERVFGEQFGIWENTGRMLQNEPPRVDPRIGSTNFDFAGDPFARQVMDSLSFGLANPDVIDDQTEAMLRSRAREGILGGLASGQQQARDELTRRGISDSGAMLGLHREGAQEASRDIARAERDIAVERKLARAENLARLQQTAATVAGDRGRLQLEADRQRQIGEMATKENEFRQRRQDLDMIFARIEHELSKPIWGGDNELLFALNALRQANDQAQTEAEQARIEDQAYALRSQILDLIATVGTHRLMG